MSNTLHTIIEQSFFKIPGKDLYQEVITHWLVTKDENNKVLSKVFSMRTNGKIFVEHATQRSADGEVNYQFPDGTIRRLIALSDVRAGDAIRGRVF